MTSIKLETPTETQARCAKFGETWLGDRVEFKVGGVSCKRSLVRALFDRHGYTEHVPADPKAEACTKRAAREGRKPKNYIAREFVSANSDTPMAIQIASVTGAGETGDSFTCLARVRIGARLDPTTGLSEPFALAKPPEGKVDYDDETARVWAEDIAARANVLMHEAQNKDMGIWMRAILSGIGAAQSLGGGNNYYVPAVLCEQLHTFMAECSTSLGLHYLRDPKTTMGASHEKAAMAAAATVSMDDKISEMTERLKDEIKKSQGKRKRDAVHEGQLELIRTEASRLKLWRGVVEDRYLAKFDKASKLLEEHYNTLLSGGNIGFAGEGDAADAPTSDTSETTESPEPATATKGDFDWCK